MQDPISPREVQAGPPGPPGQTAARSTGAEARRSRRPRRFRGPEPSINPVGVWLTLLGLTGVYFNLIVQPKGTAAFWGERAQGSLRYLLISWAVLLTGTWMVGRTAGRSGHRPVVLRAWSWAYRLLVASLTARAVFGIVHSTQDLSVDMFLLLEAVGVYVTPLVAIPAGKALFRDRLFLNGLLGHAAFGGIAALVLIVALGLYSRLSFFTTNSPLTFTGGVLIYAAPPAFLLLARFGLLGQALAFGGLGGYVAFSVVYQARINLLSLFILTLSLLFVFSRAMGDFRQVRARLFLVSIVGAIGFGMVAIRHAEDFTQAIDLVFERFTDKGTVGTSIERNERYEEAAIVTKKMTPSDWVLGRGLLGRWSDWSQYHGETRHMVHMGHLHLFFVGGVGLWALLFLVPAVLAMQSLASRDYITLVCALQVVNWAITLFAYGLPDLSPGWFVLCLALGGVFPEARPNPAPRQALEEPERPRPRRGPRRETDHPDADPANQHG